MYMIYLTLYSIITRSNHLVYIILAISVILMHMKLDIQNFIILHPFLYKMLLMYWKKCWSRIVRNLVLSMFPVMTTKA